MAALRAVRPVRVAAWDAGSSSPWYASVSTIIPEVSTPPTVETSRAPRSSRATTSTGRAKNAIGKGRSSGWDPVPGPAAGRDRGATRSAGRDAVSGVCAG